MYLSLLGVFNTHGLYNLMIMSLKVSSMILHIGKSQIRLSRFIDEISHMRTC